MADDLLEIRRCQHIRVHGAQCGSPALREEKYCYHHAHTRPERVKVKGGDGKTSEIVVPLFEDAGSIQMAVRQVAVLLLQDKIDSKKAGLMLYALQIASTNLKRMAEEAPRPAQVVVDVKRVGETPVGWTPWTFQKDGHEPEKLPDEKIARTKREILKDRENAWRAEENLRLKEQLEEITEKMEGHSDEMERWIVRDDISAEGLKAAMGLMKQAMEEVADANLHNRSISDAERLDVAEKEKWAREREKRNLQRRRF
ncbi:MAG: hypothetical protein WCB53_10420 [Terriglobales bacterium]